MRTGGLEGLLVVDLGWSSAWEGLLEGLVVCMEVLRSGTTVRLRRWRLHLSREVEGRGCTEGVVRR